MHVVLLAGQPSSIAYLEALGYAGAPPKLVVAPKHAPAAPHLASEAERWRVPYLGVGDATDAALLDRLRALAPDLVLLAGWPDAARAPLRAVARLATLELHPACPPDHRAKEPLFWAILNDHRQVRLEVRRATHELDGGPVVWSTEVEVAPDATSASLALEVDTSGARLVPAILAAARADAIPRGETIQRAGRRLPPLRSEHGLLDLTRPAIELERLVRAATGEILPYLFYRGVKVGVLRADVVPAPRRSTPGQVVAVANGVAFATAACALRIRRALFLGKSYDGETLARELGIDVGARMSNSPAF